MTEPRPTVRLHLTNVAGAGATQLLKSLLPALERDPAVQVSEIHLPDRGDLAQYQARNPATRAHPYRRRLPNALSRLLECTLLGRQFSGPSPLLVLGDLPLRCQAPQTVFVQTPHLTAPARSHWGPDGIKFAISRWVFRRNARYARAFIVQTAVMKDALVTTHPQVADRVHVLAQPVPDWLLGAGVQRSGRRAGLDDKLSLVYPAAGYPHKNHRLLGQIDPADAGQWPVERLTLTLAPDRSPAPAVSWVECSGFLQPARMIDLYRHTDALLFMSTDESYGFPLIEAMFVGLPIVCPDLPYARTLCGDGAIYFDPRSIDALKAAVSTLQSRLRGGWWPDWTLQLASIPRDWESVARAMLDIALGKGSSPPIPPPGIRP
jgi:glycosyltransferase involved in cell wall biosynthesis